MSERDPGFCQLAERCRRARAAQEAADGGGLSLRCHTDGSVSRGGVVRLPGTIPCAWGREPAPPAVVVGAGRAECAAARALRSIASGELTKRHVELVIAAAGEDLGWSEPWANVRTIYLKGAPPTNGGGIPVRPAQVLPNIGREQHTYIEHIVRRYESLAARTVFVHGRAPTCGFFLTTGARGGHLMANVSFADYVAAERGLLLKTMRFDANLTRSSLRSPFADLPWQNASLQRANRPVPPDPPGGQDCWLPWEANDFGEQLRRAVEAKQPGRPVLRFDAFFQRVFGRDPPKTIEFAQGAQFTATRAMVRRTSLATVLLTGSNGRLMPMP